MYYRIDNGMTWGCRWTLVGGLLCVDRRLAYQPMKVDCLSSKDLSKLSKYNQRSTEVLLYPV